MTMAGQSRGTGERSSSPAATNTGDDKSRTTKPDGKSGKKPEPTEIYHVVPPGSLIRDGKRLPPGELVELTAAEAEELGSAVAPGELPDPPKPISRRKAGTYRVTGPGSVLAGGVHRKPGTELTLSEDDARSLGEAVDPV